MDEQRYWYLGRSPLSIPWWTEVIKWGYEVGGERVDAPMLFSTKARAMEQLRELEGAAADEYLRLVEEHGEEYVNRAYDNTPPTMIFSLDAETLLDNLEDSDFTYVRYDGRMMLRQDFAKGLRRWMEE
jgi:DNA-binding transcriptional ArsR family regulator